MTERYPSDSTLLALQADTDTGVEYIPAGKSPFILEFRKLIQRTLLAAARANDFRVYRDGDRSVGVRRGDCVINGVARRSDGQSNITLPSNATTFILIDVSGEITLADELPENRSTFLPLARAQTNATHVTALTDLRSLAFLHVPSLASMGMTIAPELLNAVLDGVESTVSAESLNLLTSGTTSLADSLHSHARLEQSIADEAFLTVANMHPSLDANIGVAFSVPNRPAVDVQLLPDPDIGVLVQRSDGVTRQFLAATHIAFVRPGSLTTSAAETFCAVVPFDSTVIQVVLSAVTNVQSSVSADALSATVRVNGVAITASPPRLASSDGAGFRSTARGDGSPAVIASGGSAVLRRGDLVTVSFDLDASGSVTTHPTDLAVLVILRASSPE